MIVGFSGKAQSGKDLGSLMVQYLMDYDSHRYTHPISEKDFKEWVGNGHSLKSRWKNVKFADKLKDMVCVLLSCTRAELEDPIFKETSLGKAWQQYEVKYTYVGNSDGIYATYEEAVVRALSLGATPYDITNRKGLIRTTSHTPRTLLQVLGTDCGRRIIHPNIWVNATMRDYVGYSARGSDYEFEESTWVISDVRFLNEVEALKNVNGSPGICIRIERDSDLRLPELYEKFNNQGDILDWSDFINEHESETALDEYEHFDYIITNNGTREELLFNIKDVLESSNLIGNV